MCLNVIIKGTNKPNKGYKVGYINEKGQFEAYEYGTPIEKWVVCSRHMFSEMADGIPHGGNGSFSASPKGEGFYIPGFHIIKNLDDAIAFRDNRGAGWGKVWEIFECEYIGILAEGFESENLGLKDPIRIDIASHIYIHPTPLDY